MEPKNHLKSSKKVIENKLFFLLVSFGAQGLPGVTFSLDFAPLFIDFSRFLVDVGS